MEENNDISSFLTVFLAALAVILAYCYEEYAMPGAESILRNSMEDDPAKFAFLPVYDTVYTLGNSYVMIALKEQRAYLYQRDGTKKVYKISSGNSSLNNGISTPTGLYSVQSKMRTAISKQFNDCELINWIGFNGNTGFHGLKATGYYHSLGIRPSSHGCVRISNEDGADLFTRVRIGTPVTVYSAKTARVIAFGDSSLVYGHNVILNKRSSYQKRYLDDRLSSLYKGGYFSISDRAVVLDGSTALRPGGYDVGSEENIPARQRALSYKTRFKPVVTDNLKIASIICEKSNKRNISGEKARSSSKNS